VKCGVGEALQGVKEERNIIHIVKRSWAGIAQSV
jgi:hypothetical protein